jgi:hypothetical protein
MKQVNRGRRPKNQIFSDVDVDIIKKAYSALTLIKVIKK